MKYKSAASFRQALETRLRDQNLKSGLPLLRLRKMVAFDRLLARLVKESSGMWIFKGGLILQWRMGSRARTTMDVDAAITGGLDEARMHILRSAAVDLGDWFQFEGGMASRLTTGTPLIILRFPVHCLLDARTFDRFPFDVGAGDPLPEKIEELTGPPLLDFAGISPATVPCYPLTAQIAEKLRAYTRQYPGGGSTRVKDLVNILLIASQFTLDSDSLTEAIRATFQARDTHPLPTSLSEPPGRLASAYGKLAKELDLGWSDLDGAWESAGRFLDPVLQGTALKRWSPIDWVWQ